MSGENSIIKVRLSFRCMECEVLQYSGISMLCDDCYFYNYHSENVSHKESYSGLYLNDRGPNKPIKSVKIKKQEKPRCIVCRVKLNQPRDLLCDLCYNDVHDNAY